MAGFLELLRDHLTAQRGYAPIEAGRLVAHYQSIVSQGVLSADLDDVDRAVRLTADAIEAAEVETKKLPLH